MQTDDGLGHRFSGSWPVQVSISGGSHGRVHELVPPGARDPRRVATGIRRLRRPRGSPRSRPAPCARAGEHVGLVALRGGRGHRRREQENRPVQEQGPSDSPPRPSRSRCIRERLCFGRRRPARRPVDSSGPQSRGGSRRKLRSHPAGGSARDGARGGPEGRRRGGAWPKRRPGPCADSDTRRAWPWPPCAPRWPLPLRPQ
jgi:hypothetical protein